MRRHTDPVRGAGYELARKFARIFTVIVITYLAVVLGWIEPISRWIELYWPSLLLLGTILLFLSGIAECIAKLSKTRLKALLFGLLSALLLGPGSLTLMLGVVGFFDHFSLWSRIQ